MISPYLVQHSTGTTRVQGGIFQKNRAVFFVTEKLDLAPLCEERMVVLVGVVEMLLTLNIELVIWIGHSLLVLYLPLQATIFPEIHTLLNNENIIHHRLRKY